MADVSKMAEEWLNEHPDATKKEIWMAGYWQSTDNLVQPNQVNFRIMAERKVKPEIMHLMILSKCNYKCELCCNKLYDIEKIPVATVKELKTIHTLCITGGEPFMASIDIDDFARSVKKNFPNIENIFVYTSGQILMFCLPHLFSYIDGLSISPKSMKDWLALEKIANHSTSREYFNNISRLPSNRLYVFKEQVPFFEERFKPIAKKLNLNVLYRTWDKEFKTPDNEIFRRLPILLN